jgi:hypothetical protein
MDCSCDTFGGTYAVYLLVIQTMFLPSRGLAERQRDCSGPLNLTKHCAWPSRHSYQGKFTSSFMWA